jgi:hypothetical protein
VRRPSLDGPDTRAERTVHRADPGPGGNYLVYVPTRCDVTVDLSGTPGRLMAAWIRPDTGEVVRRQPVTGGQNRELSLPFSAPASVLLPGH